MNSDEERIGLLEFLELFTVPDEEGLPPIRQVQPGDNGDFIVDEQGVRAKVPDVVEMDALGLFPEERMVLLEFARDCALSFPASRSETAAWGVRMGFEIAVTGAHEIAGNGEGPPPAPPAVYHRVPAKPGRPPRPGMNEAVTQLELQWRDRPPTRPGETPITKTGLAETIAKATWPGITDTKLKSRVNTLLSRTRARASARKADQPHADLGALFLGQRPPSRS